MSCSFQLCSAIALMFWMDYSQSIPLFQGFSVQKGFEVKLQPFQFKPLSIFKEKWSPFGRFGIRKGIQKRDLPATLLPPAPVFEHVDEGNSIINDKIENVDMSAAVFSPKPLSSNLIRIPLRENLNPPTEGLYTSINQNPPNNVPENTGQPVIEEIYGELPPRPVGPIPEPNIITPRQLGPNQLFSAMPIQPVSPVPIQPVNQVLIQPGNPMFTQSVSPIPIQPVNPISIQPVSPIPVQPVGSFPIQPVGSFSAQPVNPIPIQPVGLIPEQPPVSPEGIPLITPPPRLPLAPNVSLSEIPPTDGPLVRGSKLALYFGNVFLQLVSQFMRNARSRISQLKSASSALPSLDVNN